MTNVVDSLTGGPANPQHPETSPDGDNVGDTSTPLHHPAPGQDTVCIVTVATAVSADDSSVLADNLVLEVRYQPQNDTAFTVDESSALLEQRCSVNVAAGRRGGKRSSYASVPPSNNDNVGGGDENEDTRPLEDAAPESLWEKYTSCRWILGYLLGTMTMSVHCLRNCMSMAFVCIHEAQGKQGNWTSGTETEGGNTTLARYIPQDMEGVVLSAYFYGYLVTPFLSGIIAQLWGAHLVLAVSMALSAAFTFLTPVAIRHSVTLTVILRILLGAVSGGCVPCPTAMWSAWAPRHEKAKLVTLTFMGACAGTIVANLASGFLCSVPVEEGWPFIFYTYGFLTTVWVVLWQYLARDSPERHPRIKTNELALIQLHRDSSDPMERKQKRRPVPWRRIVTSGPFLALLVTHMSFIWLLNFFGTYTPLYLYHQLHFDVQSSGVLSSAPFILAVVTSFLAAVFADRLQVGSVVSVTNNRKLFQCTGLAVAGALLCAVAFVRQEDRTIAVVMIIAAVGFHNICTSGFRINPLDLAPRLAGTITGISQSFSNLTQIVCLIVTSAVVADGEQSSWITMFIVSGCVGFTGSATFLILGSGELQPWA